MNRFQFSVVALIVMVLLIGCKEKTPNRDFIPVLKKRVFLLQEAAKQRTRVALDSLLTEDYAQDNGADSVVQFVFGNEPGFEFDRFGNTEIFYTDTRARVDGKIVGKDGRVLSDMVLIYEHVGDRWLLKRIGPGEPTGVDSQDAAIDSMIRDSLRRDSAAAGDSAR